MIERRIALPLLILLIIAACSGSKEQAQLETPVIRVDTIAAPMVDTRVFKYNERYFVRGALLAKETNIDDPVQALRVIQLVQGAHDVIVLTSFDKEGGTPTETWLGIEFQSLRVGTYALEQAGALQFYRFYLGDVRNRFDGKKASGTLIVDEVTDQAIIGSIKAEIQGEFKSFDESPRQATESVSGSFRISRVDIEDTMIGGR